jgi:adenylate cyclase
VKLLAELKRRNVFRVAVAYVVLSWLILQMGDLLFDLMGLPEWSNRIVLVILLLGFPVAVIFSWIYELTPEGIRKESAVDRSHSITPETGRKLNYITIGMIAVAILVVVIDRFLVPEQIDAQATTDRPAASTTISDDPSGETQPEPAATADGPPSIAVLPFADMSPEGDQAYFSDGLAEEILNVLVGVDDLKVASRTSSFAFRGGDSDIRTIAEKLKVQHVLEGSVRKAGNRVRITAQLIDARDDRHLWSDTFDRELDDIFAIQDEIATAVVNAMADALGSVSRVEGGLVEADTGNLDAYELFLEGRELFLARDRLDVAIGLLERAVELDPDFARAWETLAALYSVAPSWGIGDLETYLDLSERTADKALQLDPGRHFAHAIKAQTLTSRTGRIDWERAMELTDRALAGNPRDATVWLWHGINLRFMGYTDQARKSLDRCLELDPAYENCRNHVALVDWETGNLDGAFEWLDRHLTEVSVRHTVLFPYFVPEMLRRGEIRLAYLMADSLVWSFQGDARPIRWWIDGLLHPDENQEQRVDQLRAWADEHDTSIADFVWATLGQFQLVDAVFNTYQFMWRQDMAAFRASLDFQRIVRDSGMLDYWQEHGFPDRCRDLGNGAFECD